MVYAPPTRINPFGGRELAFLGGFGPIRHLVPRYRVRQPLLKATRRPVAAAIRSF